MNARANAVAIVMAVAGTMTACESKAPVEPSPTVLSVKTVVPLSGPTEGTTEMQISGSGFQAGLVVTLGGNSLEVLASNRTMIAVRTPAHEAGPVDLIVRNPDGTTVTRPGAFTYVPFGVTTVDPNVGLAGGEVSIVGTGFQPGTTATFDHQPAITRFVSSGQITMTAPAHGPGAVDVAVTDPSGVRRVIAGGFVYESATLTADPIVAGPGESLSVSWSAPHGRSALDWIGFFKIGESSTNYLSRWWSYTDGASTGTLRLSAPADPGQYEFRYLPFDGFIDAGHSAAVTVVGR